MKRRRLVIEWNDPEEVETDEQCRRSFMNGDWTIEDLLSLDKYDDPDRPNVTVTVVTLENPTDA